MNHESAPSRARAKTKSAWEGYTRALGLMVCLAGCESGPLARLRIKPVPGTPPGAPIGALHQGVLRGARGRIVSLARMAQCGSSLYAVTHDGSLLRWGLAIDGFSASGEPERVSLPSPAVEVVAGDCFVIVRHADGTLSYSIPTREASDGGTGGDIFNRVEGVSTIVDVAAQGTVAFAVQRSGLLSIWEPRDRNAAVRFYDEYSVNDAVKVEATDPIWIDSVCVLRRSGGVACRSSPRTFITSESRASMGLFLDIDGVSGAIGLTVGATHACSLSEGGEVRCWGLGFGRDSTSVPEVEGATELHAVDWFVTGTLPDYGRYEEVTYARMPDGTVRYFTARIDPRSFDSSSDSSRAAGTRLTHGVLSGVTGVQSMTFALNQAYAVGPAALSAWQFSATSP